MPAAERSLVNGQRSITTRTYEEAIKPAARVSGQKQDVWSIINEAAAKSPVKPLVNLGQGFFGYNPPEYILDAVKDCLHKVDCNQYAPPKGRPRLRKALADAYSPLFGKRLDPETCIQITTGANEGFLSICMAYIEPGDEVILLEPFFDQYLSNIQMPGGVIKYVPLRPPKNGSIRKTSAADWTFDWDTLEQTISPKTRMIVVNTPHNPVGRIFTADELKFIADLCVKNNIILVSDEVYDRLYYKDFVRTATISPEAAKLTLTVGSAGKNFYATGWRVGWVIGDPALIAPVTMAHTRICYSSPSLLQEAAAIGFERADELGFWDQTRREMQAKMARFCAVFDELGIPYSEPDGGYFVLANLGRVQMPKDYEFPPQVKDRPRDFKLAWWMIQELGLAAIPPTEFYTEQNRLVAEDWMRFAVCKPDEVLEDAKDRLRRLKPYLADP